MNPHADIYYPMDADGYLARIQTPNFFHIRLNDGDYDSILFAQRRRANSMNGNGDSYCPEMGVDTLNILMDYVPQDNYLLSGAIYWIRDYERYTTLLTGIKQQNPALQMAFCPLGDLGVELLLHPALFEHFIAFLRKKNVVIIGPEYMNALKLFDSFQHIVMPHTDAYQHKDAVIQQIDAIRALGRETNFCFMAGPMTKTVIHHFTKLDTVNSYYDIGSSWDYFFQSSPTYDWPRGQRRQWYFETIPTHNQFYGHYIV